MLWVQSDDAGRLKEEMETELHKPWRALQAEKATGALELGGMEHGRSEDQQRPE